LMKQVIRLPSSLILVVVWVLAGIAWPLRAQDLEQLAAAPGVSGYETAPGGIVELLREKLKDRSPQTDNMGNVWVTLGSGAPHRLIVTPVDSPGFVVSKITDDGYLRVQRLPQRAPHELFDALWFAQPVVVFTREGKRVPGVVAATSVHLQPGRRDPPKMNHPDDMYIDIGASSAVEVRAAGVDLLDPVALDQPVLGLGSVLEKTPGVVSSGAFAGKLTAAGIGDRFGVAALLELLPLLSVNKFKGTVTLAFVTQQWLGSRGLDRLLDELHPDEMIYVGRLIPRRASAGAQPARSPSSASPGSGVLIASMEPGKPLEGLAAEIKQVADQAKLPVSVEYSGPIPRAANAKPREFPVRFAHLGAPIAWPVTPAEFVNSHDIDSLAYVLLNYVVGSVLSGIGSGGGGGMGDGGTPLRPQHAPPVTEIVKQLVETYGVSGREDAVREKVKWLLPPWAKPETDTAGNLILHLGLAAGGVTDGNRVPRIAVVAHMDEIGYIIRKIDDDGRLEVEVLGGGNEQYFAGHAMLVHSANGNHPAVMELPDGWDAPNFVWPREGPNHEAIARVDVGARSPGEAEKLGVRLGDTITIPKKYRPLAGTRANARSFDDRMGCAALIAAAWALGPEVKGRDVTLVWSTEEEVGLRGANHFAEDAAASGKSPDYVFAVDTFVSSDSPLELDRFADAQLGKGFVVRAVDNSNVTRRDLVARVVELAKKTGIPVQYGVTGGGNDGSVFTRFGSQDIPLAWPLRYAHSPGEVIDTRDLEALARIVAVIATDW
jgi:putative aminopeptidase FrvX